MSKIFYKLPNEKLTPEEASVAESSYSVPNGYKFMHWSSSPTQDVSVAELLPGGAGVTVMQNVTYYPVINFRSLYKDLTTVTVNGAQYVACYKDFITAGQDPGYYSFDANVYDTYVEYHFTPGDGKSIMEIIVNVGGILNPAGTNYSSCNLLAKDFADFYVDLSEIPANGAKAYTAISHFGEEYCIKISNGGRTADGTNVPGGDGTYFITCLIKRNGSYLTPAQAFGSDFKEFNVEGKIFS